MYFGYKKGFSSCPFGKYITSIGVLISILITNSGCTNLSSNSLQPAAPQGVNIQQGKTTIGNSTSASEVASKVSPSVVGITATVIGEGGKKVQGVGSGIIVDERGYILTNNHVAGRNVENIVVYLYDGREVGGTNLWADPVQDLAVVKIDTDRLTAAELGDSQGIRVGEQAIAIGNPLGLTFQRTVTAGIISAVNRTIEVQGGNFMEGLIQTDASINPGNSGGPLINANGQVVGVNTVKVLTAEAMGFAVPINIAKPVISKIVRDGKFATPTMGIQGLDKELSKAYGFKATEGVHVYDCKDGGCAQKAGIKKGDTILAVNGKTINTACQLKEELYAVGPGKNIKLRVKDTSGKEKNVSFTLEEWK